MLSSWLKMYVFVTKAATIAYSKLHARAMEMILVVETKNGNRSFGPDVCRTVFVN